MSDDRTPPGHLAGRRTATDIDDATLQRVVATFTQRMSRPADFTVNLVAATLETTVREAESVVAAMTDAGIAEEGWPGRYVIAADVEVDVFPTPADLQRCHTWRVREAALADRGLNPHSLRVAGLYTQLREHAPNAAQARDWFTPRRQELLDLLNALVATIRDADSDAGPLQTGNSALAVALTEALWGLCRGLGAIEDAEAALSLGLQAVPKSDARTTAVFLARFASVLVDRHRVADALAELDTAVTFAHEADDDRVTGLVLVTRGRALQHASQAAAAVEDLRAALKIAQGRGDARVEGKVELALGWALRDLSQSGEAEIHLTLAIGLLAAFDDVVGKARAQTGLASVLTARGMPTEALELLVVALPVLRRHGNPAYVAESCQQLCLALLAQGGASDAARAAGAEAIQRYREIGRHSVAESLRHQLAEATDSG